MTAALAYGGALAVSGWLLSRGLARRHHLRALMQLGPSVQSRQPVSGAVFGFFAKLGAQRRRFLPLASILVGAVAGYHVVGPVGLIVGPLASGVALRAREARTARARRDVVDGQLAEAVVAIAAAVRAGLSLRQAVAEAAESADSPLRGELESVVQRLETGEPLETALSRLDRTLGLSDARLMVNALTIHARTGGDLPSLLEEIARLVYVRLDDRRAVRALTAQARSSGAVLAVLPIGFVALLSGTGGDGLGAFYRSPSGAGFLVAALSLQALGFAWMRRIVRRVEAT